MTAGRTGSFHEAICYDSDDHLLAVTMPFLLGGMAAGEPAVVSLSRHNAELVRAALPAAGGVTFLPGGAVYARPAAAIKQYREMLAGYVAEGADQIRIVGELPARALGATWDWWARYEAAANHAYEGFPVWSMCAYDTRVTPGAVLADVMRTHRRTARPDVGFAPSDSYVLPADFLMEPRAPSTDPLQRTPPHADLTDPSGRIAREATRAAARAVLTAQATEEMIMAVSEAVVNAYRHGRGTVRLRVWTGAERVVAAVTDDGPGPRDPFAGLLPPRDATRGGLGLWLIHLFCDHVVLDRRPGGFTIRLTAGNPHWS
ncbi:anti-sigma factor RsbA family regulatory protein [Actinoplanes sp. NEAU-A12]|uniref:Anti-sigma factor RsbA family regulatory protein n=1 Tax=Actinoplanes sandaracinus TaxID=3045177 RepID=A0ABT6WM64_9ACTN|nr:anti-sigma factor RsbA family regulatory protein [Actinoplanes sandaracinus]MDI6100819.1 anti-sigma factor RsbA family regulatory protein [Actinoplanes sandaracinus]